MAKERIELDEVESALLTRAAIEGARLRQEAAYKAEDYWLEAYRIVLKRRGFSKGAKVAPVLEGDSYVALIHEPDPKPTEAAPAPPPAPAEAPKSEEAAK